MHAVILAAGMGTRLGGQVPKSLSSIHDGMTLLGNQVQILDRLLGPDRILAVVGHEAATIMGAQPNLLFVFNPRFASTNTAKSLLCAMTRLDDDILWVNGDVYFEPTVAQLMLETQADYSRILVNTARTGPEEIKYTLHADDTVAEMSKTAVNPLGEALGMNIVLRSDRPLLVKALQEVEDQDYFEKAVERCTLSSLINMKPVDVGNCFCREVDFPEDLEAVRKHVAKSIDH